ncbi:MAG: hypothetical protein HBSAPP03_12520 [Phycisphaerae bacterium]|nr:MAG: hypothetical protein HBSAPP03_12520 [Phycisphaerae bacterium]
MAKQLLIANGTTKGLSGGDVVDLPRVTPSHRPIGEQTSSLPRPRWIMSEEDDLDDEDDEGFGDDDDFDDDADFGDDDDDFLDDDTEEDLDGEGDEDDEDDEDDDL